MSASGFSRFTLGGHGYVGHKLGFDISSGVKWTLKFDSNSNGSQTASSSTPGSPIRAKKNGSGTLTESIDNKDPIVLRSSGAAVKVTGRVRNIKTNRERSFIVSMDDAKKVSIDVTDLSTDRSSVSDLFDQTSPAGFWRILITASGFADLGVPQIASIRIEAICADKPTKSTCNIPESAVLLRGSIFFSPNADKEEELLIDQITLIDADLYLPSDEQPSVFSAATSDSIVAPNSPSRVKESKVLIGHTRIDEGSNILPVGSHRLRGSSYFSWLFSSLGLMTIFLAFVAWALTYTATISKYEALYSAFVVLSVYVLVTVIIPALSWCMQRLTKKLVVNCRSMLINSYNAWGYCGTLRQGEKLPLYAMPSPLVKAFHDGSPSMDINLGLHKRSHVTVASDMFTCMADRGSRVGLIAGFLSQREQFGCIATNDAFDHISVRCACDGVTVRPSSSPTPLITDWFYIQAVRNIDEVEPLALYMVTSGRYNSARVEQFLVGTKLRDTPPSGWCSWYHFFSNIREENLVNNAEAMVTIKAANGLHAKRQGFDLFQIDDGYQRAWGDWLTLDKKKFPTLSLKSIATMIKGKNMLPGIWMAPFAIDKHSNVAKEHPSWILRKGGPGGVPANSANCGKWFYGLDVTNPEVQTHVRNCITTMTSEWGFVYLKLDFLYAAALSGAQKSYFDRTLTRAQAMQVAMQAVTQSAGPYVYLLGCGAPMGSVIGHVHANRVSADAGLSWFPEFPLPSYDKWNLPSASSMIRNSICRMSMHARWWINDPDCMLLRRSTSITDDEIIAIATVKGMCGGSFIVSDDLAAVPEDRMRIAQQLLPATNLSAVAVDLLDTAMPELLRLNLAEENCPDGTGMTVVKCMSPWTLLAVCNWSEEPKSHKVSLSSCVGRSLYQEILSMDECRTAEGPILIHMFDFWNLDYSFIVLGDSGKLSENASKAVLHFPPVAAHSSRLYALRVMPNPLLPMYIGSNLHFSAGLEVSSFSALNTPVMSENNSNSDHSSAMTEPYGGSALDDCQVVCRSWVCKIAFEDGAVRDHSWKGYVWVYLPVEANQPLSLSGTVINFKGITPIVPVSSIVVPLSGLKGTVFKIAVGHDHAADCSPPDGLEFAKPDALLQNETTDVLEISWTDTVSKEMYESDRLGRSTVVYRS